jgi:hypothetical protein
MLDHSHPCNFHLARHFDRGWGEIAFEYRWESSGGPAQEDGSLDLAHCLLYEVTTYAGNPGSYADGWYYPPDPPFIGWAFRDPTDGRTGPVGMECFPAAQGWAWDRHKIGGRLRPPADQREYVISALQEYHFHCELCGVDAPVPGPDPGPHEVVRGFRPVSGAAGVWRYSIAKHGHSAWMAVNEDGRYLNDSAGIGFGPSCYEAD